MTRKVVAPFFILCLWAAPIVAQSIAGLPRAYDPAAEAAISGKITQVISGVGGDGAVGVHIVVKTTKGESVRVHLGPAVFIGMNNFYFFADDYVAVRGSYVTRDGDTALWARQIAKGTEVLTLRNNDGTPRWPFATTEDPDGCGVPHAPIR